MQGECILLHWLQIIGERLNSKFATCDPRSSTAEMDYRNSTASQLTSSVMAIAVLFRGTRCVMTM